MSVPSRLCAVPVWFNAGCFCHKNGRGFGAASWSNDLLVGPIDVNVTYGGGRVPGSGDIWPLPYPSNSNPSPSKP